MILRTKIKSIRVVMNKFLRVILLGKEDDHNITEIDSRWLYMLYFVYLKTVSICLSSLALP